MYSRQWPITVKNDTMAQLSLKDIRPLVAKLEEFLKESNSGDTSVFIDSLSLEKINGINEDLYMTNYRGIGVFVHYAVEGDWSKALLIPNGNFPNGEDYGDQYSPADGAMEWFFK